MWCDRRGMAVPDFQDFGAHLYPSRQVRDTGITFRASFLQRLRTTPGECGYCLARRVPPLFLVLSGLLAMGHGTTPFATRYNGNQLSRACFLSVRYKSARALGRAWPWSGASREDGGIVHRAYRTAVYIRRVCWYHRRSEAKWLGFSWVSLGGRSFVLQRTMRDDLSGAKWGKYPTTVFIPVAKSISEKQQS